MKLIGIIQASFLVLCTTQGEIGNALSYGRVPDQTQSNGFIITSPGGTPQNETKLNKNGVPIQPDIYSFRVQSDIKYRYSRTLVTSRVANRDETRGQEVVFSVVLPETAFISKFIMEIDGTPYEAYVKEKEQARNDYDTARNLGQSAGLVEKSTRNSNLFNVNVNVKPQSKVTFNLTYEELLTRRLGQYEQTINVNPNQISTIKDYQILVNIEESRNLSFVRVPNLSNNIRDNSLQEKTIEDLSGVSIYRPASNQAQISWIPSLSDQKQLDTEGKFIVHYDVHRDTDTGDFLLMQGYFVHFFAPEENSDVLPALQKHVIFILDISGSMSGRKMQQMKDSQSKILEELSPDDYFNIITFSTGVQVWIPEGREEHKTAQATPQNVNKAKTFINSLRDGGGTNIYGALMKGLSMTSAIANTKQIPEYVKSMIIFLTDGQPNEGVSNPTEIQTKIQSANENMSIPIYSLGFGQDVNFEFLKKLSLQNNAFARKIYEASDASLQLQGFYKEIASPLLTNVKFRYTSPEYNVTDATLTKFKTYFGGSEIAIAGKLVAPPYPHPDSSSEESEVTCDPAVLAKYVINIQAKGLGKGGRKVKSTMQVFEPPEKCAERDSSMANLTDIRPRTTPSPTSQEDQFLERLWAYLTIQQLVDKDLAKMNNSTEVDSKARAMEIALKYGFVTPLTSLVVVKPNSSDVTNTIPSDAVPAVARRASVHSSSSQLAPASFHFQSFPQPTIPTIAPPPLTRVQSNMDFDDLTMRQSEQEQYIRRLMEELEKDRRRQMEELEKGAANVGLARHRSPHRHNSPRSGNRYSSGLSGLPGLSYDHLMTTTRPHMTLPIAMRPSTLSLQDIAWLNQSDSLQINGTNYKIGRNSQQLSDGSGYNCKTENANSNEAVRCIHLENCVLPEFINNKTALVTSYFCPIFERNTREMYAGVCCPTGRN